MKAGTEVKHTCVNPQAKFCHDFYYYFQGTPISLQLPSLWGPGLILSQIIMVETGRYLKSTGKTRFCSSRVESDLLGELAYQESREFGMGGKGGFCNSGIYLLHSGFMDHYQNWYGYNWHLCGCKWGVHFESIVFQTFWNSKSQFLLFIRAFSGSKGCKPIISHSKVVSNTFVLVCFSSPKESTCETWKKYFISLQKRFSFLR